MSIKIGNTNVLEVSYPGGDVDLVYYLKDNKQTLVGARPFNINKFNELNNPLPYGQTEFIIGSRVGDLKTPLYKDRDVNYYYGGDVLKVTHKITTAGYLMTKDTEQKTFTLGDNTYNAGYTRKPEGASTVQLSGLLFSSTAIRDGTGDATITGSNPYQIKTTQSANIRVRGYDNCQDLAYGVNEIKLALTYYDNEIKTTTTSVDNRQVFQDTYLFNLSNGDTGNKYFISATPTFTNFRHCYIEESKDLTKMTNASGEQHNLNLVTRQANPAWTIGKGKGILEATATIKRGLISAQLGFKNEPYGNSHVSGIGSFNDVYPLDTLTTTNTPLPGYKAAINYNNAVLGRSMNNINITSPGPETYTGTINSNQYVQKFRYQLTRGNVARENGITVGLNKLGNTTLTVADPLYYNDSYNLSEYTLDTGCSAYITTEKGTVTGNIITNINASPVERTLSIVMYRGVYSYDLAIYRGSLSKKEGLTDEGIQDMDTDTDGEVYYGDYYVLDHITAEPGYKPIHPSNAEGDIEYGNMTVEVKAEKVAEPVFSTIDADYYFDSLYELYENYWTFSFKNTNQQTMTVTIDYTECDSPATPRLSSTSLTISPGQTKNVTMSTLTDTPGDTFFMGYSWSCNGVTGGGYEEMDI